MKASLPLILLAASLTLGACAVGPQSGSQTEVTAGPEQAAFYDPFATRAADDGLEALARGAGKLLD